jgi:hypothetical protein
LQQGLWNTHRSISILIFIAMQNPCHAQHHPPLMKNCSSYRYFYQTGYPGGYIRLTL